MKKDDFNAESADAVYAYQKSADNPRRFVIIKLADGKSVGDYTVLAESEDPAFSEKKVINLIALMNGRKNVSEINDETGNRMLFQIVTHKDGDGYARVLFYTLGKTGVSIENALFRIEEDEHITP